MAVYCTPSVNSHNYARDRSTLAQIVALNAQRKVEEQSGLIRYLRPEYQNPNALTAPAAQAYLGLDMAEVPVVAGRRQAWPVGLADQVRVVKDSLRAMSMQSAHVIAAGFRSARRARVAEILGTLASLGQVREVGERYVLSQ